MAACLQARSSPKFRTTGSAPCAARGSATSNCSTSSSGANLYRPSTAVFTDPRQPACWADRRVIAPLQPIPTQEVQMTTSDVTSVQEWRGRTVVDRDGDKIGKREEIYLDQETGRPEWALVNTGLFGTRSTFVPLSGADPVGNEVQVRWEKTHVKDAPSVEADGQLSHEEEAQLYEHYGFDYSGDEVDSAADRGRAAGGNGTSDTPGRDRPRPTTDDAMTRSEEELQV